MIVSEWDFAGGGIRGRSHNVRLAMHSLARFQIEIEAFSEANQQGAV